MNGLSVRLRVARSRARWWEGLVGLLGAPLVVTVHGRCRSLRRPLASLERGCLHNVSSKIYVTKFLTGLSIFDRKLVHLVHSALGRRLQRRAVVLCRAVHQPLSYPPTFTAGTKASVTVSAINHSQHSSYSTSHKASWLVRTPTSSFFWLMSVSFGGISLLSSWTSLYTWDDALHPRTGFRSFVFALVFIIVLLILGELHRASHVKARC